MSRQKSNNPAEQLVIAGASTFAGVIPRDIVPNNIYVEKTYTEEEKPTLVMMFTYSRQKLDSLITWAWVLIFSGLLGAGGWQAYREGGIWSALTIGSAALLVFNFALHLFFYWNDMFLYALHWQVPMLFALSGLMLIKPRPIPGSVLVIVLTLASAVTSFQFLAEVNEAVKQVIPVY